jgi:hypothetical protein
MPVELQVIRASEFVCLDTDQHLDFEASKKTLQGLAAACRKRGLNRALLDLRGLPVLAKPHFTTVEVKALVEAFHDAGFTARQRLAILYEHDIYGIIRDFINFSRLRGIQVDAFLDYEDAARWLSGKQEDTGERKHGVEIAIAKRKARKQPGKSAAAIPRASMARPIPKPAGNPARRRA